MKFNLTDSYVIRCKEKYDEDGLSESWKAVILISDEGKVIGMTEGDTKQLIYNVPIGVDTLEEGIPKNWTVQEGIKSLKMDTKLWVL